MTIVDSTIPPMPEPHHLVGTIVLYFHPLDWQYWPAIILDVTGAAITVTQVPEVKIVNGERVTQTVPALPTDEQTYLQVLRPRGNDWVRCTQGDGPGQWRYVYEEGYDSGQ
jgi:hypothetical protein